MERDLFLSIIVPMYNVEGYITKCLDSLNKQSDKDFEIILIDDGSSDNTYLKSVEYLQSTNLIYNIIKQENKGQSTARNLGVKKAKGEYILFLDSDDFANENMVNILKKELIKEPEDICIFDYNRVRQDGTIVENRLLNFNFIEASGIDILYGYKNNEVRLWTSSLVYRREFIEKNNLNYLGEAYAAEDLNFIFKALLVAKEIKYIDSKLTYYYQRKDSLTNSPNITKNITVIDSFDDVCKFIKNRGLNLQFIDIMKYEFIPEHIMYQLLGAMNLENKSQIKKILSLKKVKRYLKTGKYNTTRYGKVLFVWMKLACYMPNTFIKAYLKKNG